MLSYLCLISDDVYIKGHNYFEYEKDVVNPTMEFLQNLFPPYSIETKISIPNDRLELFEQIPQTYLPKDLKEGHSSRRDSLSLNRDKMLPKETPKSKMDCFDMFCWSFCLCTFCCECVTALSWNTCNQCLYLVYQRPLFEYAHLRSRDNKTTFSDIFFRRVQLKSIVEEEKFAKRKTRRRSSSRRDKMNLINNPILSMKNEKSSLHLPDNNMQTYSKSEKIDRSTPTESKRKLNYLPG